MLIKTFYSWEEAQKYATENNTDLGLFSIKDGEHNTDYKFLYQVFEPIDLTDFLDDCYVIEINEFEKSEIEFIDFALKNEEISEDEYNERLKEINKIVEQAKKYNDDIIIQYPNGVEISEKRFTLKIKIDTTTYVIGAKL